MHKFVKTLAAAACLSTLAAGLAAPTAAVAASSAEMAKEGKAIAFDRKKGNCLACHMIADGVSPGTIGPPLIGMNKRYPDKAKLRAQIWDATKANPETAMPPFGRHHVLSEDEINKVVEFIYSL